MLAACKKDSETEDSKKGWKLLLTLQMMKSGLTPDA
jgi:hypothetical protein